MTEKIIEKDDDNNNDFFLYKIISLALSMAEVQTAYCETQMDRFTIVLIPPFFSVNAYLSVIHLVERLRKKKKWNDHAH